MKSEAVSELGFRGHGPLVGAYSQHRPEARAHKADAPTAPVNVCFMIDQLSRAGTETQLLALIAALDRRRVVPHLVLLDGNEAASRALEPADCPILRMGLKSLLRPATISAMWSLRRFWRQHHIDAVQTYFLDSTYLGVPLARLCGIRQVIRVRNNLGYWLTARHRRLGRWMGRLAKCTVTNSTTGKTALMTDEQLDGSKIEVLENGVDVERFASNQPPFEKAGSIRVGMVANLRPVKNVDGLIRAAAGLHKSYPHLHFEVCGEGDQRRDLEKQIADSGLADVVQLCGAISDVPAFLARQDIAVLCSHSEGMSNAVLEYMAAGRAIVATDVGANSRLIEDGVHGLIVPPRDDAALQTAILRFLQDPDLARRLALNAQGRATKSYSRAAMVRRFEDFYTNS